MLCRAAVFHRPRKYQEFGRQYKRHGVPHARHLVSTLGRVDGFGEDEHEAESDEGSVVPGGFLARESNALEALELSDALLDAGAASRLFTSAQQQFTNRLRGSGGQLPA